jgi:hypothetical protein
VKSVTTKDDVSTAQILNTGFRADALLAAANSSKGPMPRGSYEPSRSRCLQATNFFPVVVYRMIDAVTQISDSTLMHWNYAGDKFFIDQQSPKLGPMLKRFFNRTLLPVRW